MTSEEREISAVYDDPLDLVWVRTAERLGLRIERSDEVFASYRPPAGGPGTLVISTRDAFDPDDCLAQMIFHELCHALVEAPGGLARRDWGLENVDDRDVVREHACDRLQAALADRYGLREVLAVTTKWRAYYDALGDDPLGEGEDPDALDPAVPLARQAFARATEGPWAEALAAALEATAAIARAALPFAAPDSLLGRVSPERPGSSGPGPRD